MGEVVGMMGHGWARDGNGHGWIGGVMGMGQVEV